MCICMIGTLYAFICSYKPNTLGPTFFTVLEMVWAEEMYTFQESVGDAVTMLQTGSSFLESIGLTAFPREVWNNITAVPFETRFLGLPLIGRIEFVDYNGKQLGVGTVGEQNLT